MTQHTPGPWRHVGATFPERPRIYPPKNHVDMNYIAALNSRLDEYEANARLIAAAPDLLAALEDFLMAATAQGPAEAVRQLQAQARVSARAAIAKAKGE